MNSPSFITISSFENFGDGLRTLKPIQAGEEIYRGDFLVCALNDGGSLLSRCAFCLSQGAKMKCPECAMNSYCSKNCRLADSTTHESECELAKRLKVFNKVPTKSQRILLRFLKHRKNLNVNYEVDNFDKALIEYLIQCVTIVKKYIPDLEPEPADLLYISLQLKATCFEIDDFGLGFSGLLSKINHSCDPNLSAVFDGRAVSLVAVKNICEGDQLFISYFNEAKMSKDELLKSFNFTCKCEKCLKS